MASGRLLLGPALGRCWEKTKRREIQPNLQWPKSLITGWSPSGPGTRGRTRKRTDTWLSVNLEEAGRSLKFMSGGQSG